MSKNYKLQNILFCDNDRLEAYWEMFFKSSRPVYDPFHLSFTVLCAIGH